MKSRSSRASNDREQMSSRMSKSEASSANPPALRNQVQMNQAQANAQTIRKRRSSINVYDQPSSLNSRLRQLETDMLRLDEDRTKLFDDTHLALARYELRLNEIQAILKSRQDNVEKYVEDMKLLIQAKDDFEKQAKLLHEKHDRVHEKFLHRETTISREIKMLKSKFELLEKSRQFRSILEKSRGSSAGLVADNETIDELEPIGNQRSRAEGSMSDGQSPTPDTNQKAPRVRAKKQSTGGSRGISMSKFKIKSIISFFRSIGRSKETLNRAMRSKSNKIASSAPGDDTSDKKAASDGGSEVGEERKGRASFRLGRKAGLLGRFLS